MYDRVKLVRLTTAMKDRPVTAAYVAKEVFRSDARTALRYLEALRDCGAARLEGRSERGAALYATTGAPWPDSLCERAERKNKGGRRYVPQGIWP